LVSSSAYSRFKERHMIGGGGGGGGGEIKRQNLISSQTDSTELNILPVVLAHTAGQAAWPAAKENVLSISAMSVRPHMKSRGLLIALSGD